VGALDIEGPEQGNGGADAGADAQEGGLCSITMGKNPSAKVHQLVAELQGISIAEAARLCQKPIVSLAKDVSVGEANEIKQQFAAVRVSVRISRRT
jgi:ribosomal protein L7/L12